MVNFKTLFRLGLLLCLIQPVYSQELLHSHPVDVDGDGVSEVVGLREYERDGVTYGQLVLTDKAGQTLWEGSKKVKEFTFLGEFDGGGLEAVYGDQNGVFVLASYQKSDVRPTRYRLFTWHGRGFVHLRDGALLGSQGAFVWKDDLGASRWIDRFEGSDSQGRLKAVVTDLKARSQETVLVRPGSRGFDTP